MLLVLVKFCVLPIYYCLRRRLLHIRLPLYLFTKFIDFGSHLFGFAWFSYIKPTYIALALKKIYNIKLSVFKCFYLRHQGHFFTAFKLLKLWFLVTAHYLSLRLHIS